MTLGVHTELQVQVELPSLEPSLWGVHCAGRSVHLDGTGAGACSVSQDAQRCVDAWGCDATYQEEERQPQGSGAEGETHGRQGDLRLSTARACTEVKLTWQFAFSPPESFASTSFCFAAIMTGADIQRDSHDYHHLEEAQKDLVRGGEDQHKAPPQLLPFKITHQHTRECMSEFLSTFIYCAFGLGVIAQVTLSKAQAGAYVSVTLAWGVAVMMAMHVGGGVSHSHINPAITIGLAVFGAFPWKKVPGYVISQVLGAFFGSLMIYTMFYQIIHAADPQKVATATIFHTHPNAAVNNSAAFITEMFATMTLLICLLALVDEKNRPTVVSSFPSCVGVLVVGIGMSFSLISSAALNPARDLGPRIMLSMVGYDGVFSSNNHYFWIPIVAPIVGSVLGIFIYVAFIMAHHPAAVNNKGFF